MKRAFLFLSFLVLNCGVSFAAEEITITTYYPSPYGSYNQLQAISLGIGDNDNDGLLDSGDVPTAAGDVWIKGNVGIGTRAPQNKLDVEGGAVIGTTYSGTNTAPANGLLVEGNVGIGTARPSRQFAINHATVPYESFMVNGTEQFVIGSERGLNSRDFIFYDTQASAYRMVIDTSGNVGIGTNDPQKNLHVTGNVRIGGLAGAGVIKADAQGDLVAATGADIDMFIVDNRAMTDGAMASASCPGGYKLTGGGFDYGRVFSDNGLYSRPNSALNRWECAVNVESCSSGTVENACQSTCYAVCARLV